MKIGEASKYSGLSAKAIRYYESIGLVLPKRDDKDNRNFMEKDVHKLIFLFRARSLGFTIRDCRTLLDLNEDRQGPCSDVKMIAAAHLIQIEGKILKLENIRVSLRALIDLCQENSCQKCPFLKELTGDRLPWKRKERI